MGAYNTQLLYSIANREPINWGLARQLASEEDAEQRHRDVELRRSIVDGMAQAAARTDSVNRITWAVGRGVEELRGDLQAHVGALQRAGVAMERGLELTNARLGDLVLHVQRLGDRLDYGLQTGFRRIENAIEQSQERILSSDRQLHREQTEQRRLESCYVYRAYATQIEHETAIAVLQMDAEVRALYQQFRNLYGALISQYMKHLERLVAEHVDASERELPRAHRERQHALVQAEVQRLQGALDRVRANAEAPISGWFGRAEKRRQKDEAEAAAVELRAQLARAEQRLAALVPIDPMQSRPALVRAARRLTCDEFTSSALGQSVLADAMPRFVVRLPEIDYTVCRAIEDAGSTTEYPDLGPVPTREETLNRVLALKRIAKDLECINVESLANPEMPAPLTWIRDFLQMDDDVFYEDHHRISADYQAENDLAEAQGRLLEFDDGTVMVIPGEDLEEQLRRAREILCEHRNASVSLVQRKLRISYNRATCLMKAMESEGLVSTPNDEGKRTYLGA